MSLDRTPVVPTTDTVPGSIPVMPAATATTVLPSDQLAEPGLLGKRLDAPLADNLRASGAPTGLVTSEIRGPTNIVEHQPIIEREILRENPVELRHEHHVQPIIHETEHQIQPIVRTEVTSERRVVETDRDVLLPPVVEKPVVGTGMRPEREGLLEDTAAAGSHVTIGQKIRGTLKEVAGTVTRNPAKKEEGRLLKHGIDPTKHTMA